MKIFGGILPFIGFRTISAEEAAELELLPAGRRWSTFQVEWFGFGIVIAGKPLPGE
jgi:hypothetical protein